MADTQRSRPRSLAWWQRSRPSPRTILSDEERGRAVEAACRTAMQLLAEAPDREERLTRADPVPPSTRALLRRLAAGDG